MNPDIVRSKLEVMWKEIPERLQPYMPISVIDQISMCLTQPTTVQIVKLLHEVQQLREDDLHKERCELVTEIKQRLSGLRQAHIKRRTLQEKAGLALEDLNKELKEEWEAESDEAKREMNTKDAAIIDEIENLVTEQQSSLQGVGVPLFTVTKDPLQIRVQMVLVDFLLRVVEEPDEPVAGMSF